MSDHDVQLLVPLALLAVTADLRVWHTGLVRSAELLHLAVIMEPLRGENEVTQALASARLSDLSIAVAATGATAEPVQLSYGTEGGANPTIVTRITASAVAPATYLLAIDFEQSEAELAIDYQTEFTVHP
ncbi:hypothetical protein [Nocardia altamirensis]|uniref:hypothetical protein n=1 Tax=Nocardia altamirensis TaxID=472158 RepID=UPI0008405318|nr:hypothetical protein [Nocardia altamirensis]